MRFEDSKAMLFAVFGGFVGAVIGIAAAGTEISWGNAIRLIVMYAVPIILMISFFNWWEAKQKK